ncbi:unnamed protein product [Paramecium pentaurelia]|uniref:Uncharacterized protein n=1 Tax=Paramecium pentaurelia TaxID=43138 RepID=A0A8S1SF37_9CILI|nr:unnamed protein product [Paramecium pentaurelia]
MNIFLCILELKPMYLEIIYIQDKNTFDQVQDQFIIIQLITIQNINYHIENIHKNILHLVLLNHNLAFQKVVSILQKQLISYSQNMKKNQYPKNQICKHKNYHLLVIYQKQQNKQDTNFYLVQNKLNMQNNIQEYMMLNKCKKKVPPKCITKFKSENQLMLVKVFINQQFCCTKFIFIQIELLLKEYEKQCQLYNEYYIGTSQVTVFSNGSALFTRVGMTGNVNVVRSD